MRIVLQTVEMMTFFCKRVCKSVNLTLILFNFPYNELKMAVSMAMRYHCIKLNNY